MRVDRLRIFALALLWAGCDARGAAPITLLTLNLANGAGDRYRTADARARQAAFVAASGAQLVAMQEVDLFVERSGRADCARDVARLDCTPADFSSDGVRRCDGAGGAVVYGLAFRGDDPYDAVNGVPGGIADGDSSIDPTGTDRSPDALFGNALALLDRAPTDAYAVQLPTDESQPADDPLYADLGHSAPGDAARTELAARNQALRLGPAIEPRIALVTRIARADSRPLAVIVIHLESAGTSALRLDQLARAIAVAKAERSGPPARDVVLLGDFNQSPLDIAATLGDAGFRRAVGELVPGVENYDQIWVDAALELDSADQLPTAGVSDHPNAGRATIR